MFLSLWVRYLYTYPDEWKYNSGYVMFTNPMSNSAAIFMYIHFICGLAVLTVSQVMLWPLPRKIHGYIGYVYILCSIVVSLAGLIYMRLHEPVGGRCMNIGFSIYGLLYLSASMMALTTTGREHGKWGFRLWVLGMSGLLYRILYIVLLPFFLIGRKNFSHPLDCTLNFAFYVLPIMCMYILGY
jgi:hypothetical protein